MNNKYSRGFSLLEVVVATLIGIFVMAVVAGVTTTCFKLGKETVIRNRGIYNGMLLAEHLKPLVSANPNIGTITNAGTGPGCALAQGGHTAGEVLSADMVTMLTNEGYTLSYSVKEDIAGTDCEQVTIRITCPEP